MLTPSVGTAYNFTFTVPFNVLNGIYVVQAIYNYEETVANLIDLSSLYTEVNKTAEDFNKDLPTIKSGKIYKLSSTTKNLIKYIPEHLQELEPNANVKEYMRLAIGVDLGMFDNMNDVNYVINTLKAILSSGVGITTTPIVSSLNKEWLTVDAYNAYEHTRATNKTKMVNLYTENKKLQEELEAAQTKITAYEKTLISLSNITSGL